MSEDDEIGKMNYHPICHYCGVQDHTKKICRFKKKINPRIISFNGNYNNWSTFDHKAHECRSRDKNGTSEKSFNGYFYKCNKYGHKDEVYRTRSLTNEKIVYY